ncbi:MAG: hypothetical protein WDZ35_01470 [Crocinitomicaceae bacterium]
MGEPKLIEFEFHEDILVGRYLSDSPITGEIARTIVQQRKTFTNGKACKMVIVFPKLSSIDKNGREYLSSAEAKEDILAGAMVTPSLLSRVIINFFLKFNESKKDNFPTKVFNTEEEAVYWLKSLN